MKQPINTLTIRQKNILKDLCGGDPQKQILTHYRITDRVFRAECEFIRKALGAESNAQACYIFGTMQK